MSPSLQETAPARAIEVMKNLDEMLRSKKVNFKEINDLGIPLNSEYVWALVHYLCEKGIL